MLQYKNHRFHCSGISFEIPDGYFLDTDCDSYDNSIWLYPANRSIHILIEVHDSCDGARIELERICKDKYVGSVDSFAPVTTNGLEGFMANYRYVREPNYEVWLDISDGCALSVSFADRGNGTHINMETLVETLDIRRETQTSK